MFLEEMDTIEGRHLIIPENTKWVRISQHVMRASLSPCIRDGPACKTKWNQLIHDYKRIADYFKRTGQNIPDYWELSSNERKAEGLPKHFAEDIFQSIHAWFGSRPQIQPLHVRDTMAPNDRNYQLDDNRDEHGDEDHSNPETEDPTDMRMVDAPKFTTDTTPPWSLQRTPSTPCRPELASTSTGMPNSRPVRGIPP